MNPDHAQGEANTTARDSNAPDVDPSYKNNWKYKTCSDHTHCLDGRTTKVVAEVLSALSEERLETRYYTLTLGLPDRQRRVRMGRCQRADN